jgi:hypothetical protein
MYGYGSHRYTRTRIPKLEWYSARPQRAALRRRNPHCLSASPASARARPCPVPCTVGARCASFQHALTLPDGPGFLRGSSGTFAGTASSSRSKESETGGYGIAVTLDAPHVCDGFNYNYTVTQSKTPSLALLPGTVEEVTNIRRHFPDTYIVHLEDSAATAGAVLV